MKKEGRKPMNYLPILNTVNNYCVLYSQYLAFVIYLLTT